MTKKAVYLFDYQSDKQDEQSHSKLRNIFKRIEQNLFTYHQYFPRWCEHLARAPYLFFYLSLISKIEKTF